MKIVKPAYRKNILAAVSLLVILPMLSGCIALVAGAAAGGATGYYVEKQQNQSSSH
jgi:hypothetical protein